MNGGDDAAERTPLGRRTGLLAPQDIIGGLAIAAFGAFALWLTNDLAVGRAMRMGPGYLPQLFGWMVLEGGLLLALKGFLRSGPGLERWQLRGPLFVLGAIVLFGLCVRPLGLALSAFLAAIVASFASRDAKPSESIVFAIALAAFCSVLFRYGLGLPLDTWPRALTALWR